VTGGGGTVFDEAFSMAEKMRFTNIAILTDGYCGYPQTTSVKKVLWGVINNREFAPKFGNVIHLK
jgi:predicted metal-dependent peptidase